MIGVAQRLTDLGIFEVSLVDTPANRRKFLLIKRDVEGGSRMEGKVQPIESALAFLDSLLVKNANEKLEEALTSLGVVAARGYDPQSKAMNLEAVIQTLEGLLTDDLTEEEKKGLKDVIEFLGKIKTQGYPKPSSRYPYPYPNPEVKSAEEEQPKPAESETAEKKNETQQASPEPKGITEEAVKALVESFTTAIKNDIQNLAKRVENLEKIPAISKRLTEDTNVEKNQNGDKFWSNVFPF